MTRDFLLAAVRFLIAPVFAALSIVDTACRTACSRSSGGAVSAFFMAVATPDFSAFRRAVIRLVCLSLFTVDFF